MFVSYEVPFIFESNLSNLRVKKMFTVLTPITNHQSCTERDFKNISPQRPFTKKKKTTYLYDFLSLESQQVQLWKPH